MTESIGLCPLCHHESVTAGRELRGYRYSRCQKCGFIFLPSRSCYDSDFKTTDQYDGDYFRKRLKEGLTGYMDYAEQERALRRNFKRYLKILSPFVCWSSCSMMDVGCAYGFLLDEARKLGVDVFGIDFSSAAVNWMREHLKIQGRSGDISSAPDGPFDLITASEVIEHVNDPKTFLREMSIRLKSGGLIMLVTGAADSSAVHLLGRYWWYLNPPDHCSIFSRKALRMLIEDEKLEILYHRLFPFHWVGLNNAMLKIARVLNNPLIGRIAQYVSAVTIPVPHFTTQILIARKP